MYMQMKHVVVISIHMYMTKTLVCFQILYLFSGKIHEKIHKMCESHGLGRNLETRLSPHEKWK